MITFEKLKNLFEYNQDSGELLYLVTKGRCKAGEKVGTLLTNGYLRTVIDHRSYYIHRLIFLYHHGRLPKEIDHVNGIKTDNRISNLRECLRQGNEGNKTLKSHNTSGFKGVFKCRDKWQAKIATFHIGVFATKEEAAAAYDKAALTYYGEFALTNKSMGLL